MSRTHDGHHAFFSPFGNPFKLIFSKEPKCSPKLQTLLNSFEQSVAEDIGKLKPNDTTNFLSLLWVRQAVDVLLESHNKLKVLIADLEFPPTVWDEKWIESYLDDSLNLLDVCIALVSEVSRLGQNQILLRYALQILNFCSPDPPLEKLQQAGEALDDFVQKLHSRSSKIEKAPFILQGMVGTVSLPKVNNWPKGRVLTRALYALNIEMMFVSGVLVAIFSGNSEPLMDMQVSNDFLWAAPFNDLQLIVNKELNRVLLDEQVILKELSEVDTCSRNLHATLITITQKDEKVTITQKDEKVISIDNDVEEVRKKCEEPISKLNKTATCLSHELELLGKKLNNLFDLVMSWRDGLVDSLRTFE